MYKPNPMGPWPIIDLASSLQNITPVVDTNLGSALQVCLDTANLGGNSEGFFRGQEVTDTALTSLKLRSFGVCLQPIENIIQKEAATYVDLNIVANVYSPGASATVNEYPVCVPWIGYIDTAGASIATGFAAANLVTDYQLIDVSNPDTNLAINTQILLKTIVSSGMDMDKFLCVGFSVVNQNGTTSWTGYTDFTISARYATASLGTSLYRG